MGYKEPRNKTGKGGFQDHPELRSNGRWSADTSIDYWLNYLTRVSVKKFRDWEKDHPEDERSVAESIAYARAHNARGDLNEAAFVTTRTCGNAVNRNENVEILEVDNMTTEQLYAKQRELARTIKGINKDSEKDIAKKGK